MAETAVATNGAAIAAELGTPAGLSESEARARLTSEGGNAVPDASGRSWWDIVRRNLFTFINITLLVGRYRLGGDGALSRRPARLGSGGRQWVGGGLPGDARQAPAGPDRLAQPQPGDRRPGRSGAAPRSRPDRARRCPAYPRRRPGLCRRDGRRGQRVGDGRVAADRRVRPGVEASRRSRLLRELLHLGIGLVSGRARWGRQYRRRR